jgi:Golgi phosphoprotein 3
MDGLIDQGVLNSEEYRILGIFPTTRYPLRDDRPRKQLISEIRSLVLRGEQPDRRQMMQIALIYTCALAKVIFDPEERREGRKRIGEIAKQLPVTQAINKAIQGAQAAGAG